MSILPAFSHEECFACFDHHRAEESGCSRLFFDLKEEHQCETGAQVAQVLARIPSWQSEGYYVVLMAAYELGAYFLPKLPLLKPEHQTFPLLYCLVFKQERIVSAQDMGIFWSKQSRLSSGDFHMSSMQFEHTPASYAAAIQSVLQHLKQGDTYQLNYTFRGQAEFEGSAHKLYAQLRSYQPVAYGAFIQHAERTIVSLSPELFVKKEGDWLWSKPMKGTMMRGSNPEEDAALAQTLQTDPKNRAENLIIVDLIRNDLSKLAKLGSLQVQNLFQVEAYPTLWQMTSTVKAQIKPDLGIQAVFEALFPCGSITGAPKIRTMELIQSYEKSPRGLYTGSIGFILPNFDFCFNVAIRTLILDRQKHWLQLGIGSGIVMDSTPDDEYRECLLKAAFLSRILEE